MTYEYRRKSDQRDRKIILDINRSNEIKARPYDHPLGSLSVPLPMLSQNGPAGWVKRWRWSDEAESFIETPNIHCDVSWQREIPNLFWYDRKEK